MTSLSESASPAEATIWTWQTLAAGGALVVVVCAADLLFYPHGVGLNIALFFVVIAIAILGLAPKRWTERPVQVAAAATLLAALPFAESFSLHWLAFALAMQGVLALAMTDQLGPFENWASVLVRYAVLAPVRLLGDGLRLLVEAGRLRLGSRVWRLLLAWIVPLVLAAIFVGLFAAANPLIEDGFRLIRIEALFDLVAPERVILWGFVAVVCWPLLVPRLLHWSAGEQWQGPLMPQPESVVFGAVAIRNALWLFNGLFAVQTAMDLAYLWGGVRLPEGLTYADYAHRGAYPLIVTALLAGAFVLGAMRRGGPGAQSPLIRALVLVFVVQNVWLVISSILRLKLYVDVYSLTELRLYAGAWMLLVALGLVLIVAKIVLGTSNRWLISANLVSLTLVMAVMAMVDVPALIASFNVHNAREMGGPGQSVDFYQMGLLGPAAIPALDDLLAHATFASNEDSKALSLLRGNMADQVQLAPREWQGWTWRDARLRDYIAAHPDAPEPKPAAGTSSSRPDPTASLPEEGRCSAC